MKQCIVIQEWMIGRFGLKGNELLIYGYIYGDICNQGYCSDTVNQIADWLQLNPQTTGKIINELCNKHLLVKRSGFKQGIRGRVCNYVLPEDMIDEFKGAGVL
ncbi:MAG: hypothetical protein ACI3T9_04300 [Romboutsia timonensis]